MIAISLLVLFAGADVQPPEFHAANDELRGYLLEAGESQPELRALHEEWLAALERIPQAKSLDDPRFGFTYTVRSPAGWGRYTAMLSQMFPWFGTLHKRGEKASQDADAALARFYAARNKIFADVKKAYFEYAYLAESIHIVEAQADVLKFTQDVVRSRYSLGISPQEDLLRVQIEQTKLQDRYNEFNQYRSALSARLCEALGREPGEDLPWPQPADLPAPPPPAPVVLARMRMANPELSEADLTIDGRETEIELAKKKRFPDFSIGLEYMDMKDMRNMPRTGPFLEALGASRELVTPMRIPLPGPPDPNATRAQQAVSAITGVRTFRNDLFSGTLGGAQDVNALVEAESAFDNIKMKDQINISLEFNVPIYRKKINAGIAEAEHMKTAAEHDKQRRVLALNTEAKMAVFAFQDATRRLNLYKDTLIPQAEQTYEAVQSTYSSGDSAGDFVGMLGSVQTLLDFELEKARATRDVQIAAADLEAVIGGPWETGGADGAAKVSAESATVPAPEAAAPAPAQHDSPEPVGPAK